MQESLDHNIANFSQVTPFTKGKAEKGLALDSNDPSPIPKDEVLCRIGHETVKGDRCSSEDNYKSSWWMYESDFVNVLALGQRDPAWAARVAMAIAEEWGGDCRLQVRVVLAEPLYAWSGQGKVISGTAVPYACSPSDPNAFWFPDASIKQLFIPGLDYIPFGHPSELWTSAFKFRESLPLLVAGTQISFMTGEPFAEKAALPAGLRPGSVQ